MYKYCAVGILVVALLVAYTPSQPVMPSPSSPIDIKTGLPIFPGAVKNEGDVTSYRYTIENANIDTVRRFYEDEMQALGWELLGKGDVGGTDIGNAYVLWFVKAQDIISIDIFTKENIIHVIITLSH